MGIAFSIINNIAKIQEQLKKANERNVRAALLEWHRSLVQDTLTGSRHGRTYKVPAGKASHKGGKWSGGRTYVASAPGEAPAQRTGAYRSSFKTIVENEGGEPVGYLGTPAVQGRALEEGTKDGRIKPRPHLHVSYERDKQEILKKLSQRFDEK